MGMGMEIYFENPMVMGVGMGITFENGYGCEYNYTRPESAPRPSLYKLTIVRLILLYSLLIERDYKVKFPPNKPQRIEKENTIKV